MSELGIAIVFQEVLTAASQSVLEQRLARLRRPLHSPAGPVEQRQLAADTLGRLVDGIDLDLPGGAARRSQTGRPSASSAPSCAIRESSSSTSRPPHWTCRPATDCSPRCGASRPRASASCSSRTAWTRCGDLGPRHGAAIRADDLDAWTGSNLSIPQLIADMTGHVWAIRALGGDHTLGDSTLRAADLRLVPHAAPIRLRAARWENWSDSRAWRVTGRTLSSSGCPASPQETAPSRVFWVPT